MDDATDAQKTPRGAQPPVMDAMAPVRRAAARPRRAVHPPPPPRRLDFESDAPAPPTPQ
jgi:hypothetical protein